MSEPSATQPRSFEMHHGVYFDDMDAFRVLHNARYLLLVERTIGAFWTELGWSDVLSDDTLHAYPDAAHLVRANHIEYDTPVTRVGRVCVRLWVAKLGTTSLTFGFAVLAADGSQTHARGQRVLVKIDPTSRRPTAWTPAFCTYVRQFLHAE